MTVSEIRVKILKFSEKPGCGIVPRCVEVSMQDYEKLKQEIGDLTCGTMVNSSTDEMIIMGIKIIHSSQFLSVSKDK